MLNRRNFLRGMFAAPAIVAVESIMPIKIIKPSLIMPRYKGFADFDAGLFYCPYVPLQMIQVDAVQVDAVQPLKFMTRYGVSRIRLSVKDT